jgi:Cysteine-rich secretory protein family
MEQQRREPGMNFTTKPQAILPICVTAVTVFGGVLTAAPVQADGGCIPGDQAGQVPRNARPGDNACVSPDIAALVQQENATKTDGYAAGAASTDLICKSGLVWREAFDGDAVCVSPERRQATFQENANAGVGNTGGLKPQTGVTAGGGPAAQGTGGPDQALLGLVNDARLHPEKYPLIGNSKGEPTATSAAHSTACAKPFGRSGALENSAATHNSYIATIPKPGLDDGTRAHETPGGGQVGDPGGPLARAGYGHNGEIVAAEWADNAAAVKYWMSLDGPGWGHRNAILDCTLTDAGAASFSAPDSAYKTYYTVDMGSH